MAKKNAKTEIDDNSTIEESLHNLIIMSRERYIAHQKSAWYWDHINTTTNISMTILSATATVLSVIDRKTIPDYVVAIMTGLATMLSALIGFLKPFDKRNDQMEASKRFKVMMYRIIECRSIDEYQKLRAEFYNYIAEEPFLEKMHHTSSQKHQEQMIWQLNNDMKIAILKEAEFYKKAINQFKENDVLTDDGIYHFQNKDNDDESR